MQISPINKVTVTDRTPEFVWQALDGATHYELWVNNLNTGQARIIHNPNVPHVQGAATITYTDPTVVLRNASYRWWVRAFNEDGQAGAWTPFAQFFVPTPVMTAPVGIVSTTNLPTFTWTTVPEYVRFELWVNNTDTGASRVIYEPNLTTNTFTPNLPLENGNFRAWVRAFDAENNPSQWSNPIDSEVNATIAAAPRLVSPQGFTVDNTPTFEWEALTNVSQYEILVKNMLQTGQPTVLNLTVNPVLLFNGNLGYTTNVNLPAGTYRWWIRGLNADGNPGPWAQPLDFRVVSSDVPVPGEFADVPEPEVLLASIQPDELYSDDLRSITVHPAAVVATMTGTDLESQAVIKTLPEDNGAIEEVDAVMEELATAHWWMVDDDAEVSEDLLEAIAEQLVEEDSTVVTAEIQQPANQVQGAALLGVAMASTGRRNRRGRKQSEE